MDVEKIIQISATSTRDDINGESGTVFGLTNSGRLLAYRYSGGQTTGWVEELGAEIKV